MGASITAYKQPESILGFFMPQGLVLGHAYSLISVVKVEEILDGETKEWRMVQLRNPHGAGSKSTPTEWNERWSDKSPLWEEHPQVAQALDFLPMDDGLFWMEYSDFSNLFDRIHILAKSMAQPRAQESLERRQLCSGKDLGVSLEGMESVKGLETDFRRMTIHMDPFQNAPSWVSKKGVDGLMHWYSEKGSLQAFVERNPWMKERAEIAGLM